MLNVMVVWYNDGEITYYLPPLRPDEWDRYSVAHNHFLGDDSVFWHQKQYVAIEAALRELAAHVNGDWQRFLIKDSVVNKMIHRLLVCGVSPIWA